MTDFNLKAARVQFAALLAVLAVALVVATGITTGAFVLSFSVLRDLARQGLLHEDLAWIFPAMIDGAIFLSTVAVVVLSKLDIAARDKRFFIALAVVVICISVYGNAYHAYHAASAAHRSAEAGVDLGFVPLSPTGAALIAVIPPFLVLALTHGVGILIKAIGAAHAQYVTQTRLTDPVHTDVPAPVLAKQADGVRPEEDATTDNVATVPGATPHVENSNIALSPVAGVQYAEATVAQEQATVFGHRTVEQFVAFLWTADLDPLVRQTALLKVENPDYTFAELAEATGARAASTAMRRYKKAEEAAFEAGLSIPTHAPLDEDSSQMDLHAQLIGTR